MSISLISLPDLIAHVGNEMVVVVDTNLPLSTANLKVKLGILTELTYGSGVYSAPGVIPELWADPDPDGRCRFFIEEYVGDLLDKVLDIPAVGGTAEVRCSHMVRRYKMYAVEFSGDPQTATDFITTGGIVTERKGIRGGIPKQHHLLRSYWGSTGWSILNLGNPFLDNRGPSLRTGRNQDQWLYHIWQDASSLTTAITPVRVVEYTLEDGTTGSISTTLATHQKDEVWMIPAGFAQLGLPAVETSAAQRILKYTVKLQQVIGLSTVLLSEVKEFIVDHQYYEWNTELQYLNGLGTFTQLLLRGRPELETEVDASESAAYHRKGMATYLGDTHRHATTVRNGVNHASGALTKQELRQMRELLGAKKVMVKDAQLGWVPVTILNKKQAQSDLETARTVELQYAAAWGSEVVDMFTA
jgi:hypothetical protein